MTNTEIQVGEYVRTKDGVIFKFSGYFNGKGIFSMVDENNALCGNPEKVLKKHSFNIIDLIEAGDYVNGLKIYNVEKAKNIVTEKDCLAINMQNLGSFILYENSIKSIVTKEQMEAIQYVV